MLLLRGFSFTLGYAKTPPYHRRKYLQTNVLKFQKYSGMHICEKLQRCSVERHQPPQLGPGKAAPCFMYIKVFEKRYWCPKHACTVSDCIAYIFNRGMMPQSKANLLRPLLIENFCLKYGNFTYIFPSSTSHSREYKSVLKLQETAFA